MKPTARSEREKYELAWAEPRYGERSPGLRMAPAALDWFGELGAESLTDYGCGEGKALGFFEDHGIRATGFDLVDVPRRISSAPFHEGPLWDPPSELPTTDFAFSADVLEHLPTEQIGPALEAIRAHTSVGGFFQVCTVVDRWGDHLGTRLHLTVRPWTWWRDQVALHFRIERFTHSHRWIRLWLRT